MHSGEDMEKLGEDLAKGLLEIATPKTICYCFIALNLTVGFSLYYIYG